MDLVAPTLSRLKGQPLDRQIATLRQILTLRDEDINAALMWRPTNYTLNAQEQIYSQFNGFIGKYLEWARPGNAPLGFHFWSGITALGAACQRKIFFPAGRNIYLNLYTILGGHKSTGKGQATDAATAFLRAINASLEGDPDYESRRVNIIPADITMEKIVTELAKRTKTKTTEIDGVKHSTISALDATGILPLDELTTFIGKGTWATERRIPFLVAIKESDSYSKATKHDEQTEELRNLAVSMLAGCAPDWLQNTIGSDLMGGGFLDRTMWVYREPEWDRRRGTSVVNSAPKCPLERDRLAAWVADHISGMNSRQPAQASRGVRAALHNTYLETLDREKASYEIYGPDSREKTANRTLWITTQLATLISLSEERFPPVRVREEHVELAATICRLEETSLRNFMEEGTRSKTVYWDTRIAEYVRACNGCVPRTLMIQEFRRHFNSTEELERLMKNLTDQDLLENVKWNNKRIVRETGHKCTACDPEGAMQ